MRDACAPGNATKSKRTDTHDRVARIYDYICEHPGCTTKDISFGARCAKTRWLYDALNKLLQDGRIECRVTGYVPLGHIRFNTYFPKVGVLNGLAT